MKTKLRLVDLEKVNAKLEQLSPDDALRWAADAFDGPLAVLSAFQKAGCVLCHMVARLGLQNAIDVIFVDTGVNYPETVNTVNRFRDDYGLNVISLHPAETMEEQVRNRGVLYITKEGQELCCKLRKKDPLAQIRGKYEGLLSSLHRSSGGKRGAVPSLVIDSELDLLRIHPLVRMSNEDIEAYIREHDVVYNPLHDQGYPTVSCNRCTTPVLEGEPERAGRWRHLENASKYCNINPSDRAKGGDNTEFVELSFTTAEKILHFDI